MQLFRIVRHGRDGSTGYVKDGNGRDLKLPEEKANKYIDWLYDMNGQGGSQFFTEEDDEHNDTPTPALVGGCATA